MVNWEDEQRKLARARANLKEHVAIANEYLFKQRLLAKLENKAIVEHLETSLGLMDDEYRDAYYLLFAKDPIIPEKYQRRIPDSSRGIYDVRILRLRLIDIIFTRLLEMDENLDSDSFDLTPYFSMINGTDIIAGFMFFQRDPRDDHHIEEIGLFSFDSKNKNYGKQVWEDFDECVIDYLSRGYRIDWSAWKENRACRHYDELVESLNGVKTESSDDNRIWMYHIGREE